MWSTLAAKRLNLFHGNRYQGNSEYQDYLRTQKGYEFKEAAIDKRKLVKEIEEYENGKLILKEPKLSELPSMLNDLEKYRQKLRGYETSVFMNIHNLETVLNEIIRYVAYWILYIVYIIREQKHFVFDRRMKAYFLFSKKRQNLILEIEREIGRGFKKYMHIMREERKKNKSTAKDQILEMYPMLSMKNALNAKQTITVDDFYGMVGLVNDAMKMILGDAKTLYKSMFRAVGLYEYLYRLGFSLARLQMLGRFANMYARALNENFKHANVMPGSDLYKKLIKGKKPMKHKRRTFGQLFPSLDVTSDSSLIPAALGRVPSASSPPERVPSVPMVGIV